MSNVRRARWPRETVLNWRFWVCYPVIMLLFPIAVAALCGWRWADDTFGPFAERLNVWMLKNKAGE